MIITIDELIVGDEPDAWREAGFVVHGDLCHIADVKVRLVGTSHGRRILGWTLRGIDAAGLDDPGPHSAGASAETGEAGGGPVPRTLLDGLPTGAAAPVDDTFSTSDPAAGGCACGGGDHDHPGPHPNGVIAIDHVVILTPDTARTTGALEAVGFEVRRVRETDQYGSPMLQTFFRAGPVIVELVGPVVPLGDGDPGFFGVAHIVEDIDATAAFVAPAIGEIKDAVQDGRRVATLRHRDLDMSVATAFMSI